MKNLIPHFIQEQFLKGIWSGHFRAFTMFIDLSGFTPLTEALMQKGTEGAEQLSVSLNGIFGPMVDEVYKRGGFIPYFAGDAFTAIFPVSTSDISALELLQTAHSISRRFVGAGLEIEDYGSFQIGAKIGLSMGNVVWGIVGEKHKTFYFRGKAIDASVESEHFAKDQQVVFDEKIKGLLNLRGVVQVEKGYFLYTGVLPPLVEERLPVQMPPIQKKVAHTFLPLEVVNYNQAGEFRPAVSVFISFRGVRTHRKLNDFATLILNQVQNFSGYLKELEFGDKGGVFAIFFGAPVSFENNIERALEFVLAVQDEIAKKDHLKSVDFRVGLTSGIAFTGIVGGEQRCQYAAVGNRVNLAARLMIFADWKEVLVAEEIGKDKRFLFKHKGDIHYKGIAGNVPTYKLKGRKQEEENFFTGVMVGRDFELQNLISFATPLNKREFAGVAYLYGEAGIGKSRLTFELKKELTQSEDINWFTCPADQILQKSFNPFVHFLKNYFGYSVEQNSEENHSAFEDRYRELISKLESLPNPKAVELQKELIRTKSIFAGMMGIRYKGSLWELLDARGRFQNQLSALTSLFLSESLLSPIVLQLEDGHWYDNSSKAFLSELSRKFKEYPIMILVTSRYNDDGSRPVLFDKGVLEVNRVPLSEIDLSMLSKQALQQFAERRLGGKVSSGFLNLLFRSTSGNPFYTEQVIEYFSESDLLLQEKGGWNIKNDSIKLSSSINSILMARIDRLSTLVKETVKAAAVIGREFEVPVLSEVLKESEVYQQQERNRLILLREQIKTAEQGQIWRATNNLRYIFQHSLLREAVYEMQLRARLRRIHQLIAEAIEKLYQDSMEEHYFDLAFHYEQAGIIDKTILYLRLAAADAVRNFQNQQALELYKKLINHCKATNNEAGVVDALLHKSQVEEYIGEWEACEDTLKEALELSRSNHNVVLLGKANNQLGKLIMFKGNYEEAGTYLETAITFFQDILDEGGLCDAYGNMGNLFFRQGKYEEAKSFFKESISIAQKNPEIVLSSQIVANLGLTYMNQGNYDEGIECQRLPLLLSEQRGDKASMATLYTHIGIVYFEKGDYDSALEHFEKGLKFSEELGNKQLTAIAIGSIGMVYEKKGDFEQAMKNYKKDLDLCLEMGDKQGTAIALGLIGELHNIKGEFDMAIGFLEEKGAICKELGYQKGMAKTVNALGDVFSYKGEFEKAIDYYGQAVQVSRTIDNKLVLGFSLGEISDVQLRMGNVAEAAKSHIESLKIAEALGNPDLLFEVWVIGAKIAHAKGEVDSAISQLKNLLNEDLAAKELAALHYELSKMVPNGSEHRQKALKIYEKLYSASPQYLFKLRMDALKNHLN